MLCSPEPGFGEHGKHEDLSTHVPFLPAKPCVRPSDNTFFWWVLSPFAEKARWAGRSKCRKTCFPNWPLADELFSMANRSQQWDASLPEFPKIQMRGSLCCGTPAIHRALVNGEHEQTACRGHASSSSRQARDEGVSQLHLATG